MLQAALIWVFEVKMRVYYVPTHHVQSEIKDMACDPIVYSENV